MSTYKYRRVHFLGSLVSRIALFLAMTGRKGGEARKGRHCERSEATSLRASPPFRAMRETKNFNNQDHCFFTLEAPLVF